MQLVADLTLVLAAALAGGLIAHRLRQPLIVGYILAGVLIGPFTGGLTVGHVAGIEQLAEIGVVLLLFSLGLEVSFRELAPVRAVALGGAALQMALTIAFGAGIATVLGWSWQPAVWFGALIALSSTMVALKTLQSQGRIGTLSSRVMLGLLVVQDLAVVPLMIVLPELSRPGGDVTRVVIATGRAFLLLGLTVLVATRVVPRLLAFVARWNSRELFILTTTAIALGVGYAAHSFGLSLALGAFIAGLVINESVYAHQALSDIIPLRDLFGMLFFVSVGMLLDPAVLWRQIGTVALVVTAVVIGKALIFAAVVWLFGYRRIVPLATGLTLFQVGEFAFVLARVGLADGAISENLYALALNTTVATMALTPIVSGVAPAVYARVRSREPERRRAALDLPDLAAFDHIVIAGCGRVGRAVAEGLRASGVATVTIELDDHRARQARDAGLEIVQGDATQPVILEAAQLSRARAVLVTVPAYVDVRGIVQAARRINPSIHIAARAEGPEAMRELGALGIDDVTSPELEAAIDMTRRALEYIGAPADAAGARRTPCAGACNPTRPARGPRDASRSRSARPWCCGTEARRHIIHAHDHDASGRVGVESAVIGSTIGPYRVLGKIGEGGMGEVYRARDTRLDRDVALKLLPPTFVSDPDRLMRFEREARTLASLNHPNIAAIYGIEDADGRSALVMELVEGEDLSARIARGAIPVDEALPIARQIADALETAHDAGIIHRDLKPANVKVRSDGTAKVLDFGLAKATDPGNATTATGVTNSPTITSPALTAMGIVLGTAAYMAPEQAKGRLVDRRADIWAFGVLLYEMLTGRQAFQGDDVSEVLASVLKDAPHFSALPADTPAPIRTLLQRCLQKDPARRLPSIGAARLEITEVLAGGPDAVSAAAPPPAATSRLWPALAGIATAAALVLAILLARRPAAPAPESLVFTLPTAGQALGVNAISPDGRQVLYATRTIPNQPGELRVQSLGALGAQSVPTSAGPRAGEFAVWSPDSRSVAFNVGPELRRADLVTGQTSTLLTLPNNLGVVVGPGAWGQDGTILYGTNSFETRSNGVWRVPATGGSPVQVTRVRAGEAAHAPSGLLPDGRHFLYFVERVDFTKTGEVRIGSIDAKPDAQGTSTLFLSDGPAVFAPAHNGVPDCLLYASRGNLIAQPFDVHTLALTGSPTQVASGVAGLLSAAADGRLVYRAAGGDSAQTSELVRFDRTGRKLGTIGPAGNYGEVNAFADGARLAVSRTDADGVGHVQIVDIARQLFTRLNPGNVSDYADAVSRAGLVAYTSAPTGIAHDIYVRQANGVGDACLLVSSDTVKHPNDWSPDGRYLIYDDHVPNRAQDLLIVGSDGGTPVPFLATDADETFGQFSPDGKWIAYRSTESGRAEVYVRDFAPGHVPPYGTEKVQVSVSGGDKPRWSPDGREIFYLRPDGMLMAAPVRAGAHLDVKEPVELFETHPAGYYPYAVMPGDTFVVNTQTNAGDTTAPPLVVMINWSPAR